MPHLHHNPTMDNTGFSLTPVPPIDIPLNIVDTSSCPSRHPDLSTAHLPEWLSVAPSPTEQTRLPARPRTRTQLQVEEQHFEAFFETFVESLVTNSSPASLLRNDPRGIDPNRFLRWIDKTPEYKHRLEEAQALAAEVLMMETVAIADGVSDDASGLPNEVTRDKLRIDTRQRLASFWNAKKYGDVKRVEMTTRDLTDDHLKTMTMEELQRLVVNGEYSRVEDAA